MTNLQLMLSIGIPSLLVLLNIALNRSDVLALRSEMIQLRKDLTSDMAQLRKDINSDMAQLRKDINSDMAQLRKDLTNDMTQLRDSIHRDMVLPHERVAVVESKQNN
jgi:gas vesicle protein